jgi:uncharacterized protein YndB with AHSA1/START domain
MHGTYETVDGRPAVCFERRLRHPVERVWRAVTETGELAHGVPGTLELDRRRGGIARWSHEEAGAVEGEVTECEPPHRLAFTWGEERLRFELEPVDGGAACLLRLTQFLSAADIAARDAAGWAVCLGELERHLAGEDVEGPGSEPTDEWRRHFEAFVEQGFPSGAPVPGD